jgi:two-component system CheB/CheR fusion protein
LRADEVRGKHFLNLDFGLPVQELRQPIRTALADGAGSQEVELTAVNRRGKSIQCKVTCMPLSNWHDNKSGVIVLVEEGGSQKPDAQR